MKALKRQKVVRRSAYPFTMAFFGASAFAFGVSVGIVIELYRAAPVLDLPACEEHDDGTAIVSDIPTGLLLQGV